MLSLRISSISSIRSFPIFYFKIRNSMFIAPYFFTTRCWKLSESAKSTARLCRTPSNLKKFASGIFVKATSLFLYLTSFSLSIRSRLVKLTLIRLLSLAGKMVFQFNRLISLESNYLRASLFPTCTVSLYCVFCLSPSILRRGRMDSMLTTSRNYF